MLKRAFFMLFMMSAIGIFGQNTVYNILVGTYTDKSSEGIYALSFDGRGKITAKKLLAKTDNPSFLAFSPDKKYVYAVNESGKNSAVTAFRFDREKNELVPLNKIGLENAGPCYVSVTEKHVVTANYGNGSISVLARNADGSLTDTVQTIVHQRKIFSPTRFGPSNVHQTLFSPDGKTMIATNLGKDCIYSYVYNPASEDVPLTLIEEKILTKHSGPRHAVFSKNGNFLYLLNEVSAGVTVFSVASDGKLTEIQQETAVNKPDLQNGASDIHLSPDGKYLYAANRGTANDITCFKVDKNGRLTKKFAIGTGGNAPRNFAISPDGKFLFVGNQQTDSITIFGRNNCTGKLEKLNQNVELGAPVCLLFY